MRNKKRIQTKPIIITKLVCYVSLLLVVVVGLFVMPKQFVSYDKVYSLAVSLADIKDETLVFYDYDVYATENRFQNGLNTDVNDKLVSFKERGELLLVRIPGSEISLVNKGDYWLKTDPEAYELNIEYYLIPNVNWNGNSFPSRTSINLLKEISQKVMIVYYLLAAIIALSVSIPTSIGTVRCILWLKSYKQGTEIVEEKE